MMDNLLLDEAILKKNTGRDLLLEHASNSVYQYTESYVNNTECLNRIQNETNRERYLFKVTRTVTSMDTEYVSTLAIKAESEVEEDTKSESNLFLQLENQETIKTILLDHCYYSTVFSQPDYTIPTSFSIQNEAQLKYEPINNMGKTEGIAYEDWKIKNEVNLKGEDLEQKGTRCGKLCSDETEYPIQIVKSEAMNESEEMCDVKVEDSAITSEVIIKEEVESDRISFSPDFVGQDCQVNCENYKSDHCSSKTVQVTSLNVDSQSKFPQKIEADFLKCDQCSYKTYYRTNLSRHLLRHKEPNEVDIFICHKCDFQTKYKDKLRSHHLCHQDVKKFKCDQCSYTTNCQSNFKRHCLRHGNPEGLGIFKCHKCHVQTNNKGSLLSHHRIHHSISDDSKKFKCHQCSYTTNCQSNFKRHCLQHGNPEELGIFKCHKCHVQTNNKGSLLSHHRLHHSISDDLKKFKCNKCEFQTKYKYSLKSHLKRHSHQFDMFKCDKCDFQTINQNYLLTQHQLQHNNSEDVETFKCSKCEFQTKYKVSLKSHIKNIHTLQDRDPEELNMLKGNKCDFQTIYKLFLCEKNSKE